MKVYVTVVEDEKTITRRYQGDFHEMHNKDFNEEVQDILNTHFDDNDG